MADIVLINPRFEMSYWGFEHAMPVFGKRANLPVACLPLLAALTPPGHTVTLMDENVAPIDWERCAKADLVGVTGMSVQRFRMKEVLAELKRLGRFTVVGGPWVSVREDYFGKLADVIVVGEAEETWPRFLSDWKAGRPAARYEQAQRTDMTRVPVPRFDLLDTQRYAFGSIQFSRGCPFQCEFCDIIVTFGRRPRVKTPAQVIAELEAVRAAGLRIVFVVDDNLIGNKRAIKEVLREVVAWQQKHGYPLTMFTEASLDLADDPELMALMAECNFVAVFVGIESPSEESLREAKKFQNVRAGGTLVEKVCRIQDSGMLVWCGLIMGFDSDDPGIFERQIEFVRQARIPLAMPGMLFAIPKTPLYERLEKAGRLDPADPPEFGTNVRPLRMSSAQLREGYLRVLSALYEPNAFFERVEAAYFRKGFELGYGKSRYWTRRPFRRLATESMLLAGALAVFAGLMTRVRPAELRREYRRRLWRFLRHHRRPGMVMGYLIYMAAHFHLRTMAEQMRTGQSRLVNSF
ncbi:MAG TPA: radical SAM protein [Gemmataceae bacterium]|nr:radical SAM protein [Gemmataceae bacterium]